MVYFSRLGYTKKIAYEKARELGCEIYEITAKERTNGALGFLWLGRFGMHKWGMPINEIEIDISKYKKVIIVTPIHVFTVASPVKEFCIKEKGKIKEAEYIIVHFRKDSNFTNAFKEMDNALDIKADKKESIVCKFGKVIKRKYV